MNPVPPQPATPSAEEIPLHKRADELAESLTAAYGRLLVSQSKIIAARQRADEVQRAHIEEAREILSRDSQRNGRKEFLLFLAGAMFGTFAQGFIEALADGKKVRIAVYVVVGLIGYTLFFLSLQRRR